MTDETILAKAVEKAEKNGFKPKTFAKYVASDFPIAYSVLYDHEFLKAFFGEEIIFTGGYYKVINDYKEERIKACEYHSQRMVLEEEPVKYLEKFL